MIQVRGKDMLLIEAHGHVWDKIHGRRFDTAANTPLSYGKTKIGDEIVQFMPPEFADCRCPIEVVQGYEELFGIDKVVLLQTPCYGEQNDYINSVLKKYPGRYVSIGVSNPQDKRQYLADTKLCLGEYGYKGMKFECPDIPFDMTDPNNAFIYEALLEHDAFFMVDMGWGDGPNDYPIDKLLEIAGRYPELKIMLPHLGVSRLWDPAQHKTYDALKKTLSILDKNENVWFDISGIPAMVEEFDEYPYPTLAGAVKAVKAEGAIDRVMWGSDLPTVFVSCSFKDHLHCVTRHFDFLTDDEMELVLGKTALKVWFGE